MSNEQETVRLGVRPRLTYTRSFLFRALLLSRAQFAPGFMAAGWYAYLLVIAYFVYLAASAAYSMYTSPMATILKTMANGGAPAGSGQDDEGEAG